MSSNEVAVVSKNPADEFLEVAELALGEYYTKHYLETTLAVSVILVAVLFYQGYGSFTQGWMFINSAFFLVFLARFLWVRHIIVNGIMCDGQIREDTVKFRSVSGKGYRTKIWHKVNGKTIPSYVDTVNRLGIKGEPIEVLYLESKPKRKIVIKAVPGLWSYLKEVGRVEE